jgi:hypothetical protein
VQFQTIQVDASLPDGVDDKLRRFLGYWRSKCVASRPPRRREIDPMEIAPLLGAIFLLDVEAEDFRFSLVGQDLVDRYGHIKRKSLRELMTGHDLAQTLEEHRLCVSARLPVYRQNTKQSAGMGDRQLYQRLLTPLVSDGDVVTSLAGIVVFRSYRD